MARKPTGKSRSQGRKITRAPESSALVWGVHPVQEALTTCPQAVREIYVHRDTPGQRVAEIISLAKEKGVPITHVAHKAKGIPGRMPDHDGVQGVSGRIQVPTVSLAELLDKLKSLEKPGLLLVLDSIQDPHNLGAIIRSAVAVGANGVILPKDRSASITGTVIKTSAGAVFHVDICQVTNLASSFRIIKESGFWVFGATGEAHRTLYDIDFTVPVCLVIGSEGKGLRPLVAEQCDQTVRIPMQSSLNSLNASVAASIILFEVVRQRRKGQT